jgi:type I restriction enzyme R subunit
MYVDKRLDNVLAVQTLSRLNRMYPGKETTFVLDFRNDAQDILKAFLPFYRTAKMSAVTDANLVHTLRDKLDGAKIYLWEEVLDFAKGFFDPKGKQATIQSPLKKAHDRFKAQTKEVQDLFRGDVSSYISAYDFLSQMFLHDDPNARMRFAKVRLPHRGGRRSFDQSGRPRLQGTMSKHKLDTGAGAEPGPMGLAAGVGMTLKMDVHDHHMMNEVFLHLSDADFAATPSLITRW